MIGRMALVGDHRIGEETPWCRRCQKWSCDRSESVYRGIVISEPRYSNNLRGRSPSVEMSRVFSPWAAQEEDLVDYSERAS
jgi:hypothetical protein